MRTEPFDDDALTRDAFLGGRATVLQPRSGYRAGLDPVLLAASVPARAGQAVLELGCGAAPALCCLGTRVAGLDLSGLELQPGYADLARRNLALNGLGGMIHVGDVVDPPDVLRSGAFDHVLFNPPYFEPGTRAVAADPGREIALAGPAPLAAWVALAARRLRPRGTLTVILRSERLPTLMAAIQDRLGGLELWPLLPRIGRAPRLVLMRGQKQAGTPFRFHAGFVIHSGDVHLGDADDYTDAASAVIRRGAALPFPA